MALADRLLRGCLGCSGFALALAAQVRAPRLLAQGITTAAIRGHVRVVDGRSVEGAEVRVLNTATGILVRGEVRQGQFLISGLEAGGPYVVGIRWPGLIPQQSKPLTLQVGEVVELPFAMQAASVPLDTLHVVVQTRSDAGSGIGTIVPGALVHALPTLNRNFQDFAQLAPQISTRVLAGQGGLSGGGVGLRFNSFLIDGAPEGGPTGNTSAASSAAGGGKSLPIAAVREYQVLLAPYEVRYGDFAGALVNTVTQSGTNELHGSVFGYGRNDRLARSDAGISYDRLQYGFALGGPIVRDRLHFFVAPELQRLTSAAPGPFVGQPPNAAPPVRVSEADLARFDSIMRGFGLVGGSAGPVENRNPLTNLFARFDLSLPAARSRLVLSLNYARNTNLTFSRAASDTFSLSTYQQTQLLISRLAALQLHTRLGRGGGGTNELLLSHRGGSADFRSDVRQPIVRVAVAGTGGTSQILQSGTNEGAQGTFSHPLTVRVADHLTLPLGAAHLLELGGEAEYVRVKRGGVAGAYGSWTFDSLGAFAAGRPQRFEVAQDFGTARVPLEAGWYGAYVGDRWRAGERLSVTLGVRLDKFATYGHAPYVRGIDSVFGRRTDQMPAWSPVLAPRLGFVWDVSASGRERMRGGLGVFAGRPPLGWPHTALSSYGVGGVLRCGLPSDRGPAPDFEPEVDAVPQACANGAVLADSGDVDLLDRKLRMARTLRWSLGYERELPGGLLATGEVLVTRNLSNFLFVNLNLSGPQGIDANGRVMYGSINGSGIARPARRSGFSEVIDLINTSHDHSEQFAIRLERRPARGNGLTASGGYTYSRVRDVATPFRIGRGTTNWASRAVSGRHDDLSTGISLNDVPHRTVIAAVWTAPWRRWATGLSLFYVGESGSPFTFVAYGSGTRGDLNADGAKNDPIYVPGNTADPNAIRFAGASAEQAAQQTAFDQFIGSLSCLNRQRGRLMARNSCRAPWTNTMVLSLRQAIPTGAGTDGFDVQLDVFNPLNLMNRKWGLYRVADPALLEQVGQSTSASGATQPVFRFEVNRSRWTTDATQSAFQLQLALTYRF